MEQEHRKLGFTLRVIQNKIKLIICNSVPFSAAAPRSQLQGGILGFLYHQQEPVYQRDIEREFHISRATATNTLQVMERNGLIERKALDRDARLKRILMTEEARQNQRQVEQNIDEMERCMTRGLSDSEVEQLYRMLDIVLANLEGRWREMESGPAGKQHPACCENQKQERMCDKC